MLAPQRRYNLLLVLGFPLAFALCAAAQEEAPATKAPAWNPPKPHDNAPLGEIKSIPGDGNGAYKTRQYRDLFAENGHSPAETKAKLN